MTGPASTGPETTGPETTGPETTGPETTGTVAVCQAASCLALGSDRVMDRLPAQLAAAGHDPVTVKRVGCLGLCSAGPLVRIEPGGALVERVRPDGTDRVLAALRDPSAAAPQRRFHTGQTRVVTENCGRVDPEDLDDYTARGGYGALRTALTSMTPGEVEAQVRRSGLRGRGGAGYPTGLKWSTVAKAAGAAKYVICNADEGDPGAFMDRCLLESDPHRVLEGMAIAGFAVGANQGYVYCRAEYPLAVARLHTAIGQARRAGLLGSRLTGTGFGFDIEVRLGAGAFVCGEETALIASVQGRRGTPRPRPPYPAVSGLWGRPTLINNVETFANVPAIVQRGGAWLAGMGTPTSAGTKVFALAGRVVNTGLVEVPMGITLREIVEEIGGGVVDGRRLKAVQTGGASGGCIPVELLDLPVDYESLSGAGSMMGSGGMIVMDDTVCMVDVARFFMDFCREESCGKCVPCRVGTTQLHTLLTGIADGTAGRDDLGLLERLAATVARTSLCGLGQAAPNPVFSTLRYFRDEYLAHLEDRVCPAGVCPMTESDGLGVAP
jgi:bidirectional [NiFe] hydrogenase diaphorase subunit